MGRRTQAVILAAIAVLWLCIAPFAAVGAVASPLVFDDPRNLDNPIAWLAFLLVLGGWAVCILAPLGAFAAYFKHMQGVAWAAIAAPVAWGAAAVVTLSLV